MAVAPFQEAQLHAGLFNEQEFFRCWPYLEDACKESIGLTMQILEDGLRDGSYALHTSDHAAIITEYIDLYFGRILYFSAAGGDLAEILTMKDLIEADNIKMGIDKFMIDGRPGWAKVLPDYQRKTVTLTKGF